MLDEIDAAEKKPFGQAQSPINLISICGPCSKTRIMKDDEAHVSPLKFNYPALVEDCTIMNNGHTVQINIPSSQKCTLSIKGKTYQLVQFHFHTPAEHLFDSRMLDMEMHLVHANEKSELAVLGFLFSTKSKYQRPQLELTQSRAHLVLAKESMVIENIQPQLKCIPVDESDDLETDDEWDGIDEAKKVKVSKLGQKNGNDFLAQFFDQLPSKKIDKDMELFEYDGGSTTPPFSEGVQWLVSRTEHFMNKKQLKDLSSCWEGDNNRVCQDYCGRIVKLRSNSSMQVV